MRNLMKYTPVCIVGAILNVGCQVQPLNQASPVDLNDDRMQPALMSQVEGYTPRRNLGNATEGERLFNLICTECHAYVDVDDLPTMGFELKPGGADRAPTVNEMGAPTKGELTESYLSATIQYGKSKDVEAHSMPAWGNVLTEEEVDNLVAFIKQVKQNQRVRKLP